jgi:two-component system NtrC family sensor kinase
MLPGNHIDNPLGIVESLLMGLPWATLIVDSTGRIWAANRSAHTLLVQPINTLIQEPIFDYVAGDSIKKLRQFLCTPQAETCTSAPLSIKNGLRQIVECTAHVVAIPRTRHPLWVVMLAERATPMHPLVQALSAVSAAGFDVQDTSIFFATLRQALVPLHLDAHIAVLDQHTLDLSWAYTSIDPGVLQSLEAALGLHLRDLFASSAPALDTFTEPIFVSAHEATLWRDNADHLQLHLLIGHMLWCHNYIVIPLSAHKQIFGLLILSGANLETLDVAALKPFGQLFGQILDRLRQQTDFVSERAYTNLLLKAGRAITEVTELDAVLRVICDQALILTGGMTAALWQPDEDETSMRCIMAVGAFTEQMLDYRSAMDASIVGGVFREQRSLIIDDLIQQPIADPLVGVVVPVRSAIFQVLQIQGRSVGVLSVGHQMPHCFGLAQLDVLEQYSVNAAVAIENARLHESIRRSEERYRSLFQNALEIVLTLDLEGRVISWNRAALLFLGLTAADVRDGAVNFYDLLLPETADWLRFMQERTLQGHQPNPTEIEIRRSDNSLAVVEVTMQLFLEHGQPAGVYIIGRDMTERQRQQRALTDQVAQLTALHKLSIALSSSLDRNTILQEAAEAIAHARQFDCVAIHLIHANNQYLELTASIGLDDELLEQIQRAGPTSTPWMVWQSGQARVVKTQDIPSPVRPLFERMGIVSHTFVPLITASGTYGVLAIGRSGSNAFNEGEFQVLQTMAAQIGRALENIDLYAAVEASAARYRDLYENANDLVGTMTTKGQMLGLNRAALRFFGYSAGDLAHLTLRDLLPSDGVQSVDQVLDLLQQSAMPTDTHEIQIVRHDGTSAILEMRTRLVFEGEVATTIHFIARDITERRQLEAQVRQGEKLAALGQLVAGAAHELNNPLAIVLGMSQLLLRNPLASELIDDIRDIEAAAQRAKHIVNQMLTFARAQQDVRGPVDLSLLIDRVVLNLRRSFQNNDIGVDVRVQPQLPAIWGDAYQIEQVLDNLLHNAIHALSEQASRPRTITISASATDSHIRLNIADNGPGIPSHTLPRIFDPFFTTKEIGHGTGLGLSLVYGIINKHGGTIKAESIFGQGATFLIELPVSRSNTPQVVAPVKNTPQHSSILVVEDEVDVRMILERALTQHGYDVDAVDSAEAALHKTAAKRYDLVISDLRMPGMNGNELFERVHATQPQLSWVFITGDTMSASSEAFLKQSGAPFLAKPFTLEELWDAVAASILSERSQSSQAA